MALNTLFKNKLVILFFVKGLSNLSILLCNTLFEVAKIFPPSSAGSFLQLVTIAPEFLIIGIKGSIS